MKQEFKAAKPSPLLLWLVQAKLKHDLARENTVQISPDDLEKLRRLPCGSGVILTPNHADETDPRVCLDLARRSKRRFLFMCNREAFGEMHGLAGLALQGIGYFSVERGGHDVAAKNYSTAIVKEGKDVLVIFPEGEIFYLNESLQPFHSGAVDIGMQAILEKRKSDPQWTSYILPMAIHYKYSEPIDKILEKRIASMEKRLKEAIHEYSLQNRLSTIQRDLLAREEKNYNIALEANIQNIQAGNATAPFSAEDLAKLSLRIEHARQTILRQVEDKNTALFSNQARTIDQAWQMSAHLREKLAHTIDKTKEKELKDELAALNEVAQLVSWQPQYVGSNPSENRMAEMVLKLERELYRIKRPKQLAKRDVYVRLAEPIDLGAYLDEYLSEPHQLRHKMAEILRDTIQALVNA
ncbi:MAG: 1-acyl-sn-glycerol-3-phosphate acyltransferase [Cyanobacteria bacterium REEB67]|nr:1-acyl-sn-glycerol-3-phosphate acyltransferase [Cyanobacteria bacterium REEB67]